MAAQAFREGLSKDCKGGTGKVAKPTIPGRGTVRGTVRDSTAKLSHDRVMLATISGKVVYCCAAMRQL